jgi:hypothetical protein
MPERRPGGEGFHHQSVLASSDQGEAAIPVQLLLGIYRVQLEAVRLDFEEDRKQVSPIAFI